MSIFWSSRSNPTHSTGFSCVTLSRAPARGHWRTLRAVTVGTPQDYPTEASARKSPGEQAIVLRINAEHTLGPVTASTMAALIARYEKEELPARYSTRVSYQSYLDNYVRPSWGEVPIANIRAMAVEDWLKRLKLAPKVQRARSGFDVDVVQMRSALGTGCKQPDAIGSREERQQTFGKAIGPDG